MKIIVVTDCGIGIGANSIKNTINSIKLNRVGNASGEQSILPLVVPSKISFLCLGNTNDPAFKHGIEIIMNYDF